LDNPAEIKGSMQSAFAILRKQLVEEAEGRCQACNRDIDRLGIHHRNGCGLNNQRDNLLVLCYDCHLVAHMLLRNGKHPTTGEIREGCAERLELDELFQELDVAHGVGRPWLGLVEKTRAP